LYEREEKTHISLSEEVGFFNGAGYDTYRKFMPNAEVSVMKNAELNERREASPMVRYLHTAGAQYRDRVPSCGPGI